MATTPRDHLDREERRIESLADDGEITTECRDALLEYAVALDGSKVRHKLFGADGNIVELSLRSIDAYLRNLRTVATDGNLDLLNATAKEFNETIDQLHDESSRSKTTLSSYQCAAAHFYRYHSSLGVDAEDIHVYNAPSKKKHDERDLFTEDEVDALRQACGETRWPVRNRALLELFIFTGQRIGALVTLRIKDVELNPPGNDNNSYIYLNDDYVRENGGGLKGALARGRKRPMFGARKYVRDWLEYHPEGDDPEAWLFVGDPNHWKTDPDDHLARPTAEQKLANIAEYAGVEKPSNPHAFRHYCATVLYRDYDLDFNTIRMLLGHRKGSNTLETTYSHLLDDDFIQKAEESLGYREETNRTPFTPETCPTCGELLKDGWRQCPNCQEVFGPTEQIEEAAEDIEGDVVDAALTEDLDADDRAALQAILEVVSDPNDLAAKLAQLEE
jgi:integrase/recombinase XerD